MMESDLFQFKTTFFFLPQGLIPLECPLESDTGGAVQKECDIRLDHFGKRAD